MYIAKICPSDLIKRSLSDNVTSTAESFKSWDTCMDNKTCKIVAIVGIVLAALFLFWIISTVFRCLCLGLSCLEALCCCCCRSASREYHQQEKPSAYNNPNMYGPPPQPAYQPRGYQQVDPFADNRTSYRGY